MIHLTVELLHQIFLLIVNVMPSYPNIFFVEYNDAVSETNFSWSWHQSRAIPGNFASLR